MNTDQSVTPLLLKLDLVLATLFIATMLVHLTGVAVHEWLSLIFLVPMLVHLLFHWEWVARLPGRIVNRGGGNWRLNALVDLLLYALMCFAVVSGVLASRIAFPTLGVPITEDAFWTATHHRFSNLLFPLVGVHLALHWPWLKQALSRSRNRSSGEASGTVVVEERVQ